MDDVRAVKRRVFGVVLAAGQALRFGETKQIVEVDGEPMVRRVARIARNVFGERTVLVTGHDADRVTESAQGLCAEVIRNPDYRLGLGTSLALACGALRERADALVVLLADQPLVSERHVESLLRLWSGADDEIVATRFGNTDGAPAVLPRGTFDDLVTLSGDRGARALFRDARFRLQTIPYAAAGIDIDTPEDLAGALLALRPQP